MKKLNILFVLILFVQSLVCAQNITVSWDGNKFGLISPANEADLDKMNIKEDITVTIQPSAGNQLCSGLTVTLTKSDNDLPLTLNGNSFVIPALSNEELTTLKASSNKLYLFTLNCPGTPPVVKGYEIGKTVINSGGNTITSSDLPSNIYINSPQKNSNNQDISSLFKNSRTYQNNQVHLFFDENGNSLKRFPVNVDQQDVFHIYFAVRQDQAHLYSLEVIEGEYNQVDISFRPYVNIADGVFSAQAKTGEDVQYVILEFGYGPFTSQNFQFQFKKRNESGSGTTNQGPTHKLRINKIYQVGVGVSFVQTQLADLDYAISPLPNNAGNTIVQLNDTPRPMVTFNVIWYWSVFQSQEASNITRGRDVLKDEEAFTMKRIFPTLGVSLDGNFRENLFGGFVYEFARGGSFIAGGHYGKQEVLADPNFKLGESVFTGTGDDIILSDRYRVKFFLGVNVDTRILNTLFGRGRGNE